MSHRSPSPKGRARVLAFGAVVVGSLLAGCASSAPGAVPTSTVAGTGTTAAPDLPASTNGPATPGSIAADGSVTISVTVGTDDFDTSKGTRVVSVVKGTAVTIEITDAALHEEYHLHGYEVEVAVKKGEKASISFNADTTGQFDVESHTTDKTLLVVVVTN